MIKQVEVRDIKIPSEIQRVDSIVLIQGLGNFIEFATFVAIRAYSINIFSAICICHNIKSSACGIGVVKTVIEIIFCSRKISCGVIYNQFVGAFACKSPIKCPAIISAAGTVFEKFIPTIFVAPFSNKSVFSLISVFASYDRYG